MRVGDPPVGAARSSHVDVVRHPPTAPSAYPSTHHRYTAHPLWAEVKKEAVSGLPTPPNMDKGIDLVQVRLSG